MFGNEEKRNSEDPYRVKARNLHFRNREKQENRLPPDHSTEELSLGDGLKRPRPALREGVYIPSFALTIGPVSFLADPMY